MTDDSKTSLAEDHWRTLSQAVMAGELARARSLVTPGFQWQVMGRSPQAGTYVGVEGLADLFHKVAEASDGTFQLTSEFTVGNDDTAAIVGRVTATRAGKTLDGRNVFLLQCEDGLIVRGWTIPMDQYIFDDFWSQ